MADQWVRNRDQQALLDAQAIVDGEPRPDIVVRYYGGVPEQAVADFKADVAQMVPAGWQPVSVAYASTPLDPATILSLGALSLATTPGGTLVATYRYLPPGSSPGGGALEPKHDSRPIGVNPETPGPG